MRTNFNNLGSRPRFEWRRGRAMRRRGIAVIAVLVLFAVSLTLFGLWSRAVVRERNSLTTQQFRLQTSRLAEAGLQRAISIHAADATYANEVWSVPATELDNTLSAQVRIRVSPTADAGGHRYEATAEFPVGAVRRVQITKSVEIPNPAPTKES